MTAVNRATQLVSGRVQTTDGVPQKDQLLGYLGKRANTSLLKPYARMREGDRWWRCDD